MENKLLYVLKEPHMNVELEGEVTKYPLVIVGIYDDIDKAIEYAKKKMLTGIEKTEDDIVIERDIFGTQITILMDNLVYYVIHSYGLNEVDDGRFINNRFCSE